MHVHALLLLYVYVHVHVYSGTYLCCVQHRLDVYLSVILLK